MKPIDIREKMLTDGFAVLENFLSQDEVTHLLQECSNLVSDMTIPKHLSVFCTEDNDSRDDYFINSGDKISYFFEKGAVDQSGQLLVSKERCLNKIGHALHWLNPVFKRTTFSKDVQNVLHDMNYEDPRVVQSMIIFKHPEIGGEVLPHQDSTFLYTDPPSALGFWFPLVDVTLENGCLWFIPGSHKGRLHQRYVRTSSGAPALTLQGEIPEFDDKDFIPVLVKKGDCVVIHGSVVHKSGKNTSSESRPIYTFHIVEGKGTLYDKRNWLQPTPALPFPSLYS